MNSVKFYTYLILARKKSNRNAILMKLIMIIIIIIQYAICPLLHSEAELDRHGNVGIDVLNSENFVTFTYDLHEKHFKIITHHTNTQKPILANNQTKN